MSKCLNCGTPCDGDCCSLSCVDAMYEQLEPVTFHCYECNMVWTGNGKTTACLRGHRWIGTEAEVIEDARKHKAALKLKQEQVNS